MIPHRFVVKRPTAHEVRTFCELCDELENAVLSKGNVGALLARWNQRANRVFAPHEFTQYAGAMGTRDFVLMALTPKPQHVADLTWAEAVDIARQCPAAEWATVEVRSTGPCYDDADADSTFRLN